MNSPIKHLRQLFSVSRKERNGMLVLLVLLTGSIVLRIYLFARPPKSSGWEAPLVQYAAVVQTDSLRPTPQRIQMPRMPYPRHSRPLPNYPKRKPHSLYEASTADGLQNSALRPFTAMIDINTADSVTLLKLPGIGPYFAMKILKWRDRLGGFVAHDQLLEVNRLPPETVERIGSMIHFTPDAVKKLDFNSLTWEELANHPYLSAIQARALVSYREKHGLFKSPNDLLKCLVIDSLTCNRLRPYFAAPKQDE